jgi:hypothetical protein
VSAEDAGGIDGLVLLDVEHVGGLHYGGKNIIAMLIQSSPRFISNIYSIIEMFRYEN